MSIIVSFIVHNDFSHIVGAIQTLAKATDQHCIVYVTINAGTTHQIQKLRQHFPDAVYCINNNPRGFAENHNRILRSAQTKYVALLNDDILLHRGALDKLTTYLDRHPEVGLVGPELLYPDGAYQTSAFSEPTLWRMIYKISGLGALTHDRTRLRQWLRQADIGRWLDIETLRNTRRARFVPVIRGVAMVVRRSAYEEVGSLDETTIAYGEEADWCFRMHQAGWKVALVTSAKVTHYGSGHMRYLTYGVLYVEDQKGILNYFLKHRSGVEAMVIRLAIIFFNLLLGIFWYVPARVRARGYFQAAKMGLTWRSQLASERYKD